MNIPHTRLYNAMIEAGVENVKSERDQQRVIAFLQQRACSFKALMDRFGPSMTLQELVDIERAHVHK